PTEADAASFGSNAMSLVSARLLSLSRTWMLVSFGSTASLNWRTTRAGGRRTCSLFFGCDDTRDACAWAVRAPGNARPPASASNAATSAMPSTRPSELLFVTPPAPASTSLSAIAREHHIAARGDHGADADPDPGARAAA